MLKKINMKKTATLLVLILLTGLMAQAQNRVVLNNNAFITITNSANLVIDNTNTNAVSITAGGNIISEGEYNVVKWNIGTATGNYIVPFTTASLVKIPLEVTITAAGTGTTGAIIFSTYETATDLNTAYPSDVTNMNSNCNTGNALDAVDRFWRIDAGSYSTKPTPVINFGYNDAPNEIGGTNTITESKLKAERFNSTSGLWETPLKLYGINNPVLNTVSSVSVTPADFFKSWTLIDTTHMTINIALVSISSNSICSGNTSVITPGGGNTYTLQPGNISGTSFTVNPSTTTTYTISGANAQGCLSTAASNAITTITVSATPTVSILSVSNTTICPGNTSVINPGGATSYVLNPGNVAGSSFTVSPLSSTVYTISGINAAGCISPASSVSTVTISVTPTQSISIASISNTSICPGNSSVITLNGAGSYQLLPGNITGSSFTVSPSVTTTYTITGVLGIGCLSTSANTLNTSITVFPVPGINLIYNNTVTCFGGSTNVTATAIGGTAPYSYHWQNNSSTSNVASYTTGTYTVTVSDANLCASATQTVTVNQPSTGLTVNELSLTMSCIHEANGGTTISVNGGTPPYSVLWSNGATGTSVNNAPAGNLSAVITDANGCVFNYQTTISDKPCMEVIFPQIFTPNGDGKNDTFTINAISEYPDNAFKVFNRWGSLVYSKNRYHNEWDGKPNASDAVGNGLLPSGTYFIIFEFGDGKTNPYKGYVELKY